MKKTAGNRIFHTLGGDEDEYYVFENPLKVLYHWEGESLLAGDATNHKYIVIDSAIDTVTGKEMAVQNSDVDFKNLKDLITDIESENAGHEKDQENAFGPMDNMDEQEFEPREYHRMIQKQAAGRKQRLDELDQEEGMLDTNRFHGTSERGEVFDDPEALFEDADEDLIADKSLRESKKDKMKRRLELIKERNRVLKDKTLAPSIDEEPIAINAPEDATQEAREDEDDFEEEMEESDEPALSEEQVVLDERGLPIPPRPNTRADEFANNVLSLEEVKELAPAYGDEFGYDDVEVDDKGRYKTYIMPASAPHRSELKALLIRLGDRKQIDDVEDSLKEVDKLNDLEVRYALKYYKKIDTISRNVVKHSPYEKFLDSPSVNYNVQS